MENVSVFVWEGVLSDYTDGLVIVIAENVEEARRLFFESYSKYMEVPGVVPPFVPESVTEEINELPTRVIHLSEKTREVFFINGGG